MNTAIRPTNILGRRLVLHNSPNFQPSCSSTISIFAHPKFLIAQKHYTSRGTVAVLDIKRAFDEWRGKRAKDRNNILVVFVGGISLQPQDITNQHFFHTFSEVQEHQGKRGGGGEDPEQAKSSNLPSTSAQYSSC